MRHVLIIEDDLKLQEMLVNKAKEINNKIKVHTATCKNEIDDVLKCYKINAFFIDIQLEDSNGLEIAKALRETSIYKFTPMVFITGVPTRELEAFKKVHCYDYILKPFTEDQINETFTNILGDYINRIEEEKKVVLEYKHFDHVFKESDIISIEYKNRKIHLNTTIGPIEYKRMTLTNFADKLSDHFLQVHQSYMINPKFVTKYDYLESVVILNDSHEVPVSRRYKQKIGEVLNELY